MKAFASIVAAILFTLSAQASPILPQHVLYIGHRASEFKSFLETNFATVAIIERDKFKPEQASNYDVVLLDWPQSGTSGGAWQAGSPLGNRESWNKPTVLLGSAGLNLAVAWKLHGGSGCTCLAPVAYNLRDHPIFKSPMAIDIKATTNVPTPKQFASEITNATIPVIPLVDGIREYRTVINDNARGWSSHYFEFADMPDVEVFSGGINEQYSRSAAFWRQGNLMHFGFEQSPAQLNSTGRAMLVNAIAYISRFSEDRPIDITPSVFGPEKIALTRERAGRTNVNFTNAFSQATLATFNWRDVAATKAWYTAARPWLHPNSANFLEIDAEAQLLGTPFDSSEFLPKTIAALRNEKTKSTAVELLIRYVDSSARSSVRYVDDWDKWWNENSRYVFYSELGCYRWYIDPLAKQRGIATKDLRGPARAGSAEAKAIH